MDEIYTDEYKDVLIEDEGSPYVEHSLPSSTMSYANNALMYANYAVDFVANYGWFLLFGIFAMFYLVSEVRLRFMKWQEQQEAAENHKDPDKNLAKMEAIQRAREAQQRRLEEASQRARELQQEREEKKRAETLERLRKYGTAAGQRLGSNDDDYMPLSAGASTSSYRPPKRSKCGGGGCGR